jgi:DNA invertase Pin-like site-specific DNA recombinase
LAGEEGDQRQACAVGEPSVTSVFREVFPMKVAVYARVSTADQTCDNQLLELRRYVEARGWTAVEYVDHGVSGAKDRRPALDQLVADVRRHKVQAVVCWRLDRLGRNLRHLVMLLDDWNARGVAFVTLGEGIDTSTPAGRLVAGVLGSIAEFERARIQERIHAGLARARAQGKRIGRPRISPLPTTAPAGLTVRQAAAAWGVSKSTAARRLRGEAPRSACGSGGYSRSVETQ